jgi:hypothetical protein
MRDGTLGELSPVDPGRLPAQLTHTDRLVPLADV